MTRFVKDCACDVVGCETNSVRFDVSRGDEDTVTAYVRFQPGPSCPDCHKPWRREEVKP